MVVINSVCGCAAGACRPGVLMAVANATKKPKAMRSRRSGIKTQTQINKNLAILSKLK
jgi:putative YphP/YqiW family bacilliredoxin